MPQRMPASMLVGFAVGAIVAGESKQITKQLADPVTKVVRLADVDDARLFGGHRSPSPFGNDIDTWRIRRSGISLPHYMGKVIANPDRTNPAV
ncbi:MAG: hypothetical protein ACLQAT_20210 [Candidatus Binataceae bacterium]